MCVCGEGHNSVPEQFFFFLMFYFSFERERERERAQAGGRGAEREETQNLKQAPGSELSPQSPTWGSNS